MSRTTKTFTALTAEKARNDALDYVRENSLAGLAKIHSPKPNFDGNKTPKNYEVKLDITR